MASLIFAHAKSVVNNAKREARRIAFEEEKMGKDYKERYHFWYDKCLVNSYDEFDDYLYVAQQLHGQYLKALGNKQSYFITIRPDCSKVHFLEFKEKVDSFVARTCFTSVKYSFEQKATTPSELGEGFHVHLVAQSKHRSKGECLRDTLSSWNTWISEGKIASNCIDVSVTRNGESLVQNYLIDYKSDDGHKEPTKSMDELWRLENNLLALYEK